MSRIIPTKTCCYCSRFIMNIELSTEYLCEIINHGEIILQTAGYLAYVTLSKIKKEAI